MPVRGLVQHLACSKCPVHVDCNCYYLAAIFFFFLLADQGDMNLHMSPC